MNFLDKYINEYLTIASNKYVIAEYTAYTQLTNSLLLFSYNSQLSNNILACTQLHINLWEQLEEDSPILSKMEFLINKIFKCSQEIEKNWKFILDLKENAYKAAYLYTMFSTFILNDEAKSQSTKEM